MQLDMSGLWNPRPSPRPMPNKAAEVLRKLKERGATGVTWDDFPIGFALRSRIADLRKEGYDIATFKDQLEGGTIRARYVLLG